MNGVYHWKDDFKTCKIAEPENRRGIPRTPDQPQEFRVGTPVSIFWQKLEDVLSVTVSATSVGSLRTSRNGAFSKQRTARGEQGQPSPALHSRSSSAFWGLQWEWGCSMDHSGAGKASLHRDS